MPRASSPLPASLVRAAERFADWRARRTGRVIPDDLWSMAAELAARHGVSRTAKALHVQYYDLKKRLPAGMASGPGPEPRFVEILTSPTVSSGEVHIEFERAGGTKMRIRLPGASAPVLADLSRVFLESRA